MQLLLIFLRISTLYYYNSVSSSSDSMDALAYRREYVMSLKHNVMQMRSLLCIIISAIQCAT